MKCKNVSIILLIFILTIVFYISCYILLKDLKEYKESDKSTEKLIEESIEIKEETQKRSIDWEYLKSINKDIIAWIEIENTKIDYPILKDKDVYYLKHTFDKSIIAMVQYLRLIHIHLKIKKLLYMVII